MVGKGAATFNLASDERMLERLVIGRVYFRKVTD
jgi:hypothetical protein